MNLINKPYSAVVQSDVASLFVDQLWCGLWRFLAARVLSSAQDDDGYI